MISLILMIAAFILFLLAAFNVSLNPPRVSFGWLGFACWVLASLLGGVGPHL